MGKPKAYLACPMTGAVPGRTLSEIIRGLKERYDVFYPPTDSITNDVGFKVAEQNRSIIAECDIVFVVWDGNSRWVLFAMGMAFAMHKSIRIIDTRPMTEWMSFENVLAQWHKESSKDDRRDEDTDEGAAERNDTS